MKVLILGGAGTMGGGAAAILIKWDEVKKVTLADLNEEAVKNYAKKLDSPKIDTVQINVLDREALIALAKNYDVVLNAVGPFVKFGYQILDAIIDAGVPYIDVCDDHDATEKMLELDEKAKAHNVPAIICLGTTPGTSNMQAKLVYEKLDSVDSLKICWAVGMPPLPPGTKINLRGKDLLSPAAWAHMIHVSTGDVPIWKNGKWDTMAALEYGEYIDFCEPLGRAESYYLGHAEPITLPRYLKINDFCACLGSLMPDVTLELRETARGHKEALHAPVKPDTPQWKGPDFWEKRGVFAGQAAIAEGTRNGEKLRITARVQMSHADSVPYNYGAQAIGAYLLGKGAIARRGVFGPEAALDTKEYFNLFRDVFNMMTGCNLSVDELVLVEEEKI